jgi:hypothetical protein
MGLSSPLDGSSDIGVLSLLPVRYLLERGDEARQVDEIPSVQVLSDRQSSLSLCLYALLGAGLFRSAPLVKKLSFGCIPSWYHDGGPFRIGHSLAISPDCLCAMQVQCLVQPNWGAEGRVPKYHQEAIVSFWRRLQLMSITLASRGPPGVSS